MEVKFKNFYNRHIMLELPIIKTDFLFEISQDFDQITHARPQHPIVLIDIISLYFNCISSVEYMFSKGHIMVTSCLFPWYDPSGWRKKCLHTFWTADYFDLFTFSHSKWCMKVIRNAQMSK